jgi:glutamyl-tRNA reductase
MLRNLKLLTITHKTAKLKELSGFVLKPTTENTVQTQLYTLKTTFALEELCYLATCNRVLFVFTTSQQTDPNFVHRFFQAINADLPNDFQKSVQILEGEAAIAHLFEVAASIDSLVVGERQILGQLREAYDRCHAWGLTGDTLRLAFQQAIVAAKDIYADTRIGDKPVSVASLAVRKMLAAHLPKTARVLLVGAGQTNALVAKFLAKHGFTNVAVFNRNTQKAREIAALASGNAHALADLDQYENGFDCLIVCTGAHEPIITTAVYRQLLKGETDEKIVIDLAIPHNVEEAVVHNFSVRYIEIEGLRALAQENLAFREEEVEKAKLLLQKHIKHFPHLYQQRQITLALHRVPDEIKALKIRALNEVFRKEVEQLDAATRELVEKMLTYMEQKCIAVPMKVAREASVQSAFATATADK